MIKLSEKLHFGKHLRLLHFKRFLDRLNITPSTILDAGCGDGTFSLYLTKKYPQAVITGLDSNQEGIDYLQKSYNGAGNIAFITMDLNNLPSLNVKYDMLIMMDVLEHITDDRSLIKSCFDRLNKNGSFVLHVPNKDFDKEGKYGLRRFRKEKQVHHEHIRNGYSKSELFEMFRSAGFKNIHLEYTVGPISMFAHTIFEFYRGHNYLLYFLLHPVMMILAHIDILIYADRLNNGGGLILVAEKQ